MPVGHGMDPRVSATAFGLLRPRMTKGGGVHETGSRPNAQVDNLVTGVAAGSIILWAENIFAGLMAAAKAVGDWVSALSFPF